ncbi:zinc-binding protein A33-like [Rana temporaria]|uniref:zinc-binding protein A33-like n=1 Tax=Rana temporaria TaxID=8407 RepID=UPI001AADD25D|nr:zinc-binding protein A33-like [Rana temporaria]
MVECGFIDKALVGKEPFMCPGCKEEITEKRCTRNRDLANLVKTAGVSTPGTTPAKTIAKENIPPRENCHEHGEGLNIFCKDDGDSRDALSVKCLRNMPTTSSFPSWRRWVCSRA